uniref:Uncharacterized protein n=1 Tax=viral metagenome TaxID=1070528 RepID=A0A6H1ZR26_9ZZZZ
MIVMPPIKYEPRQQFHCQICGQESHINLGGSQQLKLCQKHIKVFYNDKEAFFKELSKANIEFFHEKAYRMILRLAFIDKVARRQQKIPQYKKKDFCESCGITKEELDKRGSKLLRHHIRYCPLESVTLCGSCHCSLHQRIGKPNRI